MRKRALLLPLVIAAAIAILAVTWGPSAIETTQAALDGPANMALVVKQGGVGLCSSQVQPPAPTQEDKCLIEKGTLFTLSVYLKDKPQPGYIGFQTLVTWTGQPDKDQLNYLPGTADEEIVWPDGMLPTSLVGAEGPNSVAHADSTGLIPPFPVSSHKGNLVDLLFECKPGPDKQNIRFDLISYADHQQGAGLWLPNGSIIASPPVSLKIACVPPPQDGQININVVNADDQSQKLDDTCWWIFEAAGGILVDIVSDNNAKPAACDDTGPGTEDLSDKDPAAGSIAITIPAGAIATWGTVWIVVQTQAPDGYNVDGTLYLCTLSGQNKKPPPNDGLIACDEGDPIVIKNVAKPPLNDSFLDPTVVGGLPYSDSVVTKAATVAPNDPPISCKDSYGHSVWYQYTPPADQTVTVDTFGSDYDTVVAVFGGTKGDLTEIGCNDDTLPNPQSRLVVKLTGAITYHILVGSWNGDPGGKLVFNMEVKDTPWYDRIVIDVGAPDQNPKVVETVSAFVCQFTGEGVTAVLKDVELDVNDPPLINREIWSGTFSTKCMNTSNGVDIYLMPEDPTNALLIKECRVENTSSGETAPCNVTPNPGVPQNPGEYQIFKATVKPSKLPHPGDTDGDGCSDVDENGPDEMQGGQRDYLNPWDYYDVAGIAGPDQFIDLGNDILGVILHYAPAGGPPYDVAFDRGPSAGPNSWDMTAPDGVIDLGNDILGVILQYAHDCT